MVRPWSANRLISRINSVSMPGSRPEVGSSKKKRPGLVSSSTPMETRFCWPPLNWRGIGRHAQLGGVIQGLENGQLHVDDIFLRHIADGGTNRIEFFVDVDRPIDYHPPLGSGTVT